MTRAEALRLALQALDDKAHAEETRGGELDDEVAKADAFGESTATYEALANYWWKRYEDTINAHWMLSAELDALEGTDTDA